MSGSEQDFKLRINTDKINKNMIKDILNSLEKALEKEVELK